MIGDYSQAVHPMRTAKILAIVGVVAVALFAAVLVALLLLVNPDIFKAQIAESVKESTGRELVLAGDIKLSVFPEIALELGPASLGNPPGFGAEPFLKFEHAALHVKLLPLLRKRLELAGVALDGLDLRLRKNAAGKGNWEGFGEGEKQAQSANPNVDLGQSLPYVAGVRITNGRLSYQDIVVDKLNLETGAFTDRGVIPITLGFEVDLGAPGEHASVNAKFDVSSDAATHAVRFAAVSLSGLASRPGGNQPTHWEMSAPTIDVDLGRQTVQASSFALRYLGAEVTGKLEATKIVDDLSATGSVVLAPLLLREFIPRLSLPLPKTRDPRALSQLAASSDFAYDAKGVRLEKIQVQLDDTKLKGSFALSSGDARSVKFDLAIDQIDADRYLAPEGTPAGPGPKAGAAKGSGAGAKADDSPPWEANGTLALGKLRFSKMDFTAMRLTVAAKNKVVHLFPTQAMIDGGRYSGDVTLDSRGAVPRISLDEHLAGIDMGLLLGKTAGKNRVSGHGSVNLKATAQGDGADAILKSLTGSFDANLADGALEGLDLGYEFGVAQALIDHKPPPSGGNTGRTKFDEFKLSAQIVNGVATTRDLSIVSQVLRVKGQGSANLSSKAIDLQVLASVLKSPTATVADIPMKITGTYADPTVRPDLEALAKGQLGKKLQNLLQDKLKGLFGK